MSEGGILRPVIDLNAEKRVAAAAAAELVTDGMTVGLGTGSTVAPLLPALAARKLDIRCVATSPATEVAARDLGLEVEPFEDIERLDIAIDGADQIAPDGWLVKGGGGAHLREKIVAAAASRFVVIADSSKEVDVLRAPVPVELLAFGLTATLRRIEELGEVQLRDSPPSPDGGVIADLRTEPLDPADLAVRLDGDPGVAAHGLFPGSMVTDIFIGQGEGVEYTRAPWPS